MGDRILELIRQELRRISQMSILVVEDNPDDEELIRRVIRMLELDATFVHTAAAAVEAASKSAYNMCLLDLRLPDSDEPVALIDRIKRANPMMDIVVVTGSLSDNNLREVLNKRAVTIVLKPLHREALENLVANK